MEKIDNFNIYRSLQAGDHRFIALWELFNLSLEPRQLLEWFNNKQDTSFISDYSVIHKKNHTIAIYDISHRFNAEEENIYYPSINSMMDENKRFDMTYKNFEEILLHWELLRVSMPDIILLVIHEDNHVTLETDPKLSKSTKMLVMLLISINNRKNSLKNYKFSLDRNLRYNTYYIINFPIFNVLQIL